MPRFIPGATFGAVVCAVVCGGVADGCLTRPVEAGSPITNTNFTTSIEQSTIDKVDVLFDIDNSASMGDKQAYLAQAIPDLVNRLVTPNCVKTVNGVTTITGVSGLDGSCTDPMSNAEFSPVHNLHLGIVSSSLGARLGDRCPSTGADSTQMLAGGATIPRHNDDQAHLLNRSADPTTLSNYTESPLADAPGPFDFLDWFPPAATSPNNVGVANPTAPALPEIATPPMLQSDFQKLVVGVHQFGCGIESQLETWYRFLIQPDPYGSLAIVPPTMLGIAQWVGVDTTILQQRADFLRPDSLVAIIVLTDENDSEVDVRSFSGTGYNFMAQGFNPPRGTSICLTDPKNAACTSCFFGGNANDSECKKGPHDDKADPTDWGADLNLRHVHEKQKYGVSVQFPIERYVIGLTSPKVPNRDGEYPPDGKGAYASSYQGLNTGNLNCTNPLFAKQLPTAPNGNVGSWQPQYTSGSPPADPNNDLCNLPIGTRKPQLVFYAHIGGVPHELLQVNPKQTDLASQSQKATLSADDWKLILGNDPENFDYSGIDPHMVESYLDRTTLSPALTVPNNGFPLSPAASAEGSDPISGREWITDSNPPLHTGLLVDREYACIFKLVDAQGNAKHRDCSNAAVTADPTLVDSCDCEAPAMGTFTHEQIPAVCDDATPTQQDSAKAYPTIRELLLAKLMGSQGVISSLCPIHTYDMMGGNDPLYGYRPAMDAIVNALKSQLGITCLPQRLNIDPTTNQVPCLVLGTFPSGSNAPISCASISGGGWTDPDPDVLAHFKKDQHAAWLASGNTAFTDPLTELTCELHQDAPNMDCSVKTAAGAVSNAWCYNENLVNGGCAQAILFTPSAKGQNVDTSLQCLEQQPAVLDAGVVPLAD